MPVTTGAKLGWDQAAASSSDLNSIQYALYIDGVRTVLNNVTCASDASTGGYGCSASIPSMTAGSHTLELASFVVGGGGEIAESAKSSALLVSVSASRVVAIVAQPSAAPETATAGGGLALATAIDSAFTSRILTSDRVSLSIRQLAAGLNQPTDLAFAPDGRLYIAERAGLIKVLRSGGAETATVLDLGNEVSIPEGGLLAIALDPAFTDNHFLYALSTMRVRGGDPQFVLSRYREAGGQFAERAVLMGRVPASTNGAAGSLRFGPDGKLYVALGDATGGRDAPNLGSYSGKVLRLSPDGTTPVDQTSSSPVYASNHPLPRALAWQPSTSALWMVESTASGGARLTSDTLARTKGDASRVVYTLQDGGGPTGAAFYDGSLIKEFRGNLFVPMSGGRYVMRIVFDAGTPARVISGERLLEGQVGAISAIAIGQDGALYLSNETSLFRLAP